MSGKFLKNYLLYSENYYLQEIMNLEEEIQLELKSRGADFVYFVDISQLPAEQNKNYSNAILIGITLSPEYLKEISDTPDFVLNMISNNQINEDEFDLKEKKADYLADYIANFLSLKGFYTYSQSEDNLSLSGFYDEKTKNTLLPHKTIALLAGLGWIGKHNLLVSPDFGSAFCMCTVLTDAPFRTVINSLSIPKCGNCIICSNICSVDAIKGKTWNITVPRDEMVDVYKCTCCLRCLVFCPWTQSYMNKNI